MSEVYETGCYVWDDDDRTPEDDDLFPYPTFLIHVKATLTTASSYEGEEDDEEIEPCSFTEPQTESVVCEQTHEVLVRNLVCDDDQNNVVSSSVRVRDMLLSMDIPVQDFMVERILACAQRMGTFDQRYRNRKVLRMSVEIEAVVDELPDDEEEQHSIINNESETETAITKLKKVLVESPKNCCCPICYEEFLVGTEATSMPACSHLFHPHCLIPWLYKKKHCPMCRSELN